MDLLSFVTSEFQEVRAAQAEQRTSLARIEDKIDNKMMSSDERHRRIEGALEKRIRSLEGNQKKVAGAFGLFTILLSIGFALIKFWR